MDGQTDGWTDRETPLPLSLKRGKKRLKYVFIGFHMDGWTDVGTEGETDRWMGSLTERWTDRPMDIGTSGWKFFPPFPHKGAEKA